MYNAMSKTKITIIIERDFPLTDEEISIAMGDFRARLQGYYTKCPESLKTANIIITYDKAYNNAPIV